MPGEPDRRTRTAMKFLKRWQSRRLLGSLPRQPISRSFGFDLGEPIDRYYIEQFLQAQSRHIRGEVLEVADTAYARRFGATAVKRARALHATADNPGADFVGDLAQGSGLPRDEIDCFIMTQTLPFIYDLRAAAHHAVQVLKPGGHLLVTVPGITPVSRYDMDRWGHFWSFTDLSLRRLFEAEVGPANVAVSSFGNARVAAAFLYGLPQEALTRADLEPVDADYQLVITAVVRRPGPVDSR